jgi:hypothetical protein
VHELEVGSGVSTLLKRDPVQGDFSPEQYATELVWAPARDGTLVPVSLAWRRDRFQRDGTAPMLQYAYGSYGLSSDPRFSIPVLSLLDRGFVYAIAHIRGGDDLGVLEGQAGLGQPALDQRDGGHGLAQAHHPTHARHCPNCALRILQSGKFVSKQSVLQADQFIVPITQSVAVIFILGQLADIDIKINITIF